MFEAVKFTESHVNSRYQATVLKQKIRLRAIAPLDACQQLKELIKQITDTDLGIMGLVLHCACMLFDSISKENANMVEHCGELVMSVLAAMRPRMLLVECTLLGDTLVAIERWLVSLQQHFGAADFIAGLDRAKDEWEILDFVCRFLCLVPTSSMDEGLSKAIDAAYQILLRCKESPCCIGLHHILGIKVFCSWKTEYPNAMKLAECLREYQERYLISANAASKGIAMMFGLDIKFPRPKETNPPETAMLPLAYLRYNRKSLPIGDRKYRGSVAVNPYNSSFTDKQWSLSALLSFTAMLPDTLSSILVHNHSTKGREKYKWRLADKEIVGYIESTDLETFEIHVTHFTPSLFSHCEYQGHGIHVLQANAMKRSSPVAKTIKKYCVQFMPKTQLVQHLSLTKYAKKLEPQSIIQLLATCDGAKAVHFGDNDSLLSACWVAPWAPSAISNASYFSLDASFYALRPYVYCVPHVIHCNTSIPIGISVATSETAALYEQFFNILPAESREKLRQKICITDEGSAVGSFLSSHGIRQVLCHRHLIQSFGASGLLGALVRWILKSSSPDSFEKRKDYARNVILVNS